MKRMHTGEEIQEIARDSATKLFRVDALFQVTHSTNAFSIVFDFVTSRDLNALPEDVTQDALIEAFVIAFSNDQHSANTYTLKHGTPPEGAIFHLLYNEETDRYTASIQNGTNVVFPAGVTPTLAQVVAWLKAGTYYRISCQDLATRRARFWTKPE